ncbi:MAG: ABC transporter substrate-binding protein [Pseudomonadales bacterium]|nr:ABC transporter substrate-binding protein [Pseudomonadales bacterium]
MKFCTLLIIVCVFAGCTNKQSEPIRIGINPWPGYEFMFLAGHKGFFKRVGLDIELVQLGSLSDAQRAYINGKTDGMATTIIEAVQSSPLGGAPLKVVLIPDYSNGGDVIVANKSVGDMKSLKGKKVGCEVSSLGIYILQRALSRAGLTLQDVEVVNVEQFQGEKYMLEGIIDAFVSYPPVSVKILNHNQYHTVFTSAEIPNEIIDTISLSETIIKANPDLVPKLHLAWQLALDYYKTNPTDAIAIMAKREGIAPDEFAGVLSDLVILDNAEQIKIFSDPDKLQTAAKSVCETLVHVESISTDCENYPDIIYRGKI